MRNALSRLPGFAKARGLILAAAACVPLAGCYDLEIKQTLRPDGTLAAGADLRFEPEMEEVFGFFEALAQLRPEVPQGSFRDGLCGSVSHVMGAVPNAGAATPPVSGRQFQEGGRFVCQVEVGLGGAEQAFQALQANPAMLMSPYRVKSEGPRRYRITLDFASLPPPDDMLRMGIAAGVMNGKPRADGTLPPPPSPAALDDIAAKYKKASIAGAKMYGRDRTISFAVGAPKIVESNGKVSADGRTVRFSYTWLEMTAMLFDAEKRRNAVHYAVVEY
jgi:hypothetical protein